jgi:hypothetical protein
MSYFHFKSPTGRHPDHPSRDPERALAEKKGREQYAKMKFADESERRDYLKRVAANQHNVVGLPAVYPPEVIKSSFTRSDWNCETMGHHWSNTQEKFCLECDIDKVDFEAQLTNQVSQGQEVQ